MNDRKSQFNYIIGRPEFRLAWVTLVVIVLAFVIGTVMFGPLFALIEGIAWIIIFILSLLAIYRTAETGRTTTVERNELKGILGSLDDGLIVYDKDFKVTFFNSAAERLFKLKMSDVTAKPLSPRDVDEDARRILAQVIFPSLAPQVLVRSKEGEYPQVVDLVFKDPELDLRVTTMPIMDENADPIAFMKIIKDRTPQVTALRSRGEFITVASHQLRGPVTDINWALQSLAHVEGLEETDKMILDNALKASDNLLRRIEDLLSIARMEDGQFGYQFEETEIVEYVGKILSDVLPAARKAGIKIYFDRPAEAMPMVTIDPKRLSLAIVNILENAIRYNVENGEIIVRVDRMADKPFIVVSVRDTGIGIPKESIQKLFSKFYRADNALKTQTEGSGLGLYIARSIVVAHGGQIWADSELGRGTTISFALPTDPTLVPRREVSAEELL